MQLKPHLEKLKAAISNPKCSQQDISLLEEAMELYNEWDRKLSTLWSEPLRLDTLG